MAIRSKTFLQEDLDKEAIGKDVAVLKELSHDQRRALSQFWSDSGKLTTKDSALGEELRSFLLKHGVSGQAYHTAQKLILFIRECLSREDAPEVVLRDLCDTVAIGAPGAGDEFTAFDFLKSMLPAAEAAFQESRRDRAVHRGMPFLTDVGYTCDVRMVLDRAFNSLTGKATDHQPQPIEWIPVGIVSLDTDEKTNLFFQIDLHRLMRLIEVLGALRKELETARQTLKEAGLPALHLCPKDSAE